MKFTTYVRQLFGGAEMSAIKIHAAIDTRISENYIHQNSRGLWLEWMVQGTIVERNVFHDNSGDDGMAEVAHGLFLFANNVFLSKTSQVVWSRGGAYVHNLFAGSFSIKQRDDCCRKTPYMKSHSCVAAGYHENVSGDMCFCNNIFVDGGDLSQYDTSVLPIYLGGNVFLKGSVSCTQETEPLQKKRI